MLPFQQTYIDNCLAVRELSAFTVGGVGEFDRYFDRATENRRRVRELVRQNTGLLETELLPLLDDLYLQSAETLAALEEFADALMKGPKALDIPLACQLHEALLSRARRSGKREVVIRELYKLGMARFGLWNMLTGLDVPELLGFTNRMRYCFVEASSYLKYFDEFDDETRAYILRSTANIYLGTYEDWRDKLACVRSTMQIFTDSRYRETAPSLPWDKYLQSIHRQMTGVVPYSLPCGSLSPDEVADVMESAHLVYEKKFEDVRHEGLSVEAHNLLPYYATEFSCGLITREQLLSSLEELMDRADPTLYDQANIYQIVSLPAYYVQYLRTMPEMIPPRRQYVARLYDRLLRYVRAMPNEAVTDSVLLFIRQNISVFMELEDGLSYRELLLSLMARFAPELFAHGVLVSRLARAICEAILEGDPSCFDDLPNLPASPEERSAAVLRLADCASLLHDVGMINFTSLYSNLSRKMLHSENEILRCHTAAGRLYLSQHDSTRDCADGALGHHRWYDGSDGYPDGYQRLESPWRVLVDVLSVADYFDRDDGAEDLAASFDRRLTEIFQLEGRRFSPLIAGWLRDPKLQAELRAICQDGLRECYLRCFRAADGPAVRG